MTQARVTKVLTGLLEKMILSAGMLNGKGVSLGRTGMGLSHPHMESLSRDGKTNGALITSFGYLSPALSGAICNPGSPRYISLYNSLALLKLCRFGFSHLLLKEF